MLRSKSVYFWLRLVLYLVYLVNGLIAIPLNSVTYDEMDHWSYGKRILKGQPQKVYTYDDAGISPFFAINALPRAAEQVLNSSLSKTDGGFSDIMHGRYITLLICLLTGVLVFHWSKELFGEQAALFSLALFVFCPNLNGHSILFNSDAYVALFVLATFYSFWKFLRGHGKWYFFLFCITLGLAQVIKYSMLHLFVIFAVLSFVILIRRRTLLSGWKRNGIRLLGLLFIVLFIINASYLFYDMGKTPGDFEFRSEAFNELKSAPLVKNISLPLPAPYVEGLDVIQHMNELGGGHPLVAGRNYILGEYRAGDGFWYYYIILLIYKTPLPYLLGFLLLLISFRVPVNRKTDKEAAIITGIGIVYLLGFFSLFSNVQAGIRHIIFIYPLLYVLSGRIFLLPWKKRPGRSVLGFFFLYTLVSFYYYFPNLISYSNELIPDKKQAYRIMSDSNIDYGQGHFTIEHYLKKHPDVKIPDSIPGPGRYVLGVNDFLDVSGSGKYRWLRDFKPVSHVNHCYLLFDIGAGDPEGKFPGN